MSKIENIGALGVNADDHDTIDDTTPVVIDANPSRFVLGILNKSTSDNLIVTIMTQPLLIIDRINRKDRHS